MMNDDEQRALNAFLDTQIDLFVRTNRLMPPLEFNQALFAAGIAYAQKWRSMESEKPARWQFCIVAVDGIVPQAVLEWDGAQFLIGLSDSKYPFPVTHWMPLPLPPTEAK